MQEQLDCSTLGNCFLLEFRVPRKLRMDDRDFCASESARLGLVHKSMLESMEADGAMIWCRELMVIRETVRRQWLPDWPLSNLE